MKDMDEILRVLICKVGQKKRRRNWVTLQRSLKTFKTARGVHSTLDDQMCMSAIATSTSKFSNASLPI